MSNELDVQTVEQQFDRKTQFVIPELNWGDFSGKIEKLNRRAARLEIAPIVVTILAEEMREIEKTNGEFIKWITIKVEGETPRLNGWRFVGAAEYIGGQVLLHTVRGIPIPNKYRTLPPLCDHCKKERVRKSTYILQNETTKEFLQVGRRCLADFLRTTNPQGFAEAAEFLQSANDLASDAESLSEEGVFDPEEVRGNGTRVTTYVEGIDFLAHVTQQIRLCGYVSRTTAYLGSGKVPTAERAMDEMRRRRNASFRYEPPTPTDKQKTEDAIMWARGLDPSDPQLNEYLSNLHIVAKMEYVPRKQLYLLASLILAHERELERRGNAELHKIKDARCVVAGFVGNVGERQTFELKYIGTKLLGDSGYGSRYVTITNKLHKFETRDGAQVVWFSTNGMRDGVGGLIREGEWCVLKATVKEHKTYNEIPQTVITRCAAIRNIELPDVPTSNSFAGAAQCEMEEERESG